MAISTRPWRQHTYMHEQKLGKVRMEETRIASERAHMSTIRAIASRTYQSKSWAKDRWSTIINNLERKQQRTHHMVQERFYHMLPKDTDTERQRDIFHALHSAPLTVSMQDLAEILNLETSSWQSPLTSPGYHFYLRSWTLSAPELTLVLEFLEDADMAFEEMTEWRKALELDAPRDEQLDVTYFTIRYLGTVKGPQRPYDQYVKDLTARRSGVLHDFSQAIEELIPGFAGGHVALIKDASLDTCVSERIRDDTERVLIESFGYSTLLNRQDGGIFTSSLPVEEAAEQYRNTNVRFYYRFVENAYGAPPTIRSGLVEHFRGVRQFTEDNRDATGADRHAFGTELRDAVTRQAMPYLYRKAVTPLVLVGKDITLNNYLTETAFWTETAFCTGQGQASSLAAAFLCRILRTEANATGHEWEWKDTSIDFNIFPFVNLWCWLKHRSHRDAIRFLRQYFRIVRPLVAVTFGRLVNGLLRADFTES